jgi:hypothetical protein
VQTVLLPSGYRVRGVVPGLAELAKRGLLDTRAQQAVLRLAASRFVEETTDAESADWQVAVDAYVAGFPREAQDPGSDEWKPAPLTIDDLANLDQRDRHLLQLLVLRIYTPEQITAQVEAGEWDMEESGDLDSLAEFRDEPDGAAGRPDGEDVADPPIADPAGGG